MSPRIEAILPLLEITANIFHPIGIFKSKDLDADSIIRLIVLMIIGCSVVWPMFVTTIVSLGMVKKKDDIPIHIQKFGGMYVLSTIVSIYTSIRGSAMFYAYHDVPYSVQYNGVVPNDLSSDEMALCEKLLTHTAYTNEIFLSYLSVETIYLFVYYGEYGGKIDAIIHHAGFLIGSIVNHYHMSFLIIFTVLIQGEWSTPFLNLRLVLREFGITSLVVNFCFMVTFFLVRIVIFGYGVYHMTKSIYIDDGEPHPAMSNTIQNIVYGILWAMWMLNIYWMNLIIRMALRAVSKLNKSENKKEKQK